jgi:hypothetical protein
LKDNPRRELEARLRGLSDVNERAAIAARMIVNRFEVHGREFVVVGGSAVAIWDPGAHTSHDIDLVGPGWPVALDQVLVDEFEFVHEGRLWFDEDLRLAVEVPAWTLEPVGAETAIVDGIRVIRLDDLVLDRVGQWHATGSLESWRQAARLLEHQLLDHEYLASRASAVHLEDALDAVRLLASFERGGGAVDSPRTHDVLRALQVGGLQRARDVLGEGSTR